jgi:hypothetical protein
MWQYTLPEGDFYFVQKAFAEHLFIFSVLLLHTQPDFH